MVTQVSGIFPSLIIRCFLLSLWSLIQLFTAAVINKEAKIPGSYKTSIELAKSKKKLKKEGDKSVAAKKILTIIDKLENQTGGKERRGNKRKATEEAVEEEEEEVSFMGVAEKDMHGLD